MKTLFKKPGVIVFSLFFLIQCVSEHDTEFKQGNPYGGVLKLSCPGSLETLDPQKIMFGTDWKISALVFEGLTGYNENADSVKPVLAKSWIEFDQGKRFIFELRKNIYFHDDPCFPNGIGRKLNAYDVLYTFKRIADKQTRCPNWYLFHDKIEGVTDFYNQKSSEISGITVLDSLHIEFRLTRPYTSFLKFLSTPSASIICKEAVEFYRDKIKQHPVGTGAFRLSNWKQLVDVSLVKNAHYWQKDSLGRPLPYLDGVHIKLISNTVVRISEFVNGNLHLLEANEQTFRKLKDEPGFDSKYTMVSRQPDLGVRFFGFALDKETLLSKEPIMRRAIATAFNRDEIWKKGNSGPLPTHTYVPEYFFKKTAFHWYDYNLNLARQWMAKVNPRLSKQVIKIASNHEYSELEALRQGIEALHLNCIIDLRKVRYYPSLLEDRPDIFRISFYPNYPDPEEYYFLFHSGNAPENNLTGYKNPEYDRILERAVIEHNKIKRQELFERLEKILKHDVPLLYLKPSPPAYILTSKIVHGLKVNFNTLDFSRLWLDKPDVSKK